MIVACGVKVARGRPSPVRRIVQFRARERIVAVTTSPRNEYRAVGQQGRRVPPACGVEVTRSVKRKRGFAVRQCRHRRRSQKKRDREEKRKLSAERREIRSEEGRYFYDL